MNKKNKELGFIDLETGSKPILPLNHVFLNYTFDNKEYWETLREMINIIYRAYIAHYPHTMITLIKNGIIVKTEYANYKDLNSTTPKRQDMRIESKDKFDYIDFQNNPSTEPPVEERSAEYFGYTLTRGPSKPASSIWLINGSVDKLMQDDVFSNYILIKEENNHRHSITSNILYVNLQLLAKADNQAGELAGVLIGEMKTPTDPKVKQILQRLEQSFKTFKKDKEMPNIMTLREMIAAEAEAKAAAEKEELVEQITKLGVRIKELEALLTKHINLGGI